jgi:hypothetical protein
MRHNRPPRPEFKIGVVEGYAVHIDKADLPAWEQKGFVDTGGRPAIVPMPPDKVWVWGIPETLATVGSNRLLGRRIDGFSTSLGTYGMGGCDFFGIRLAPDNSAKFGEYLVLPISDAAHFVLINGSPMFGQKNDVEENPGWVEILAGSSIAQVQLAARECDLVLSKDEATYTLTLYLDSPAPGVGNYHRGDYERGQIADYLIFQDRRGMLTT